MQNNPTNDNNANPIARMLMAARKEMEVKLDALQEELNKTLTDEQRSQAWKAISLLHDLTAVVTLQEVYLLGGLTGAGVSYCDALVMRMHELKTISNLDLSGRLFVNVYRVEPKGTVCTRTVLCAPGTENVITGHLEAAFKNVEGVYELRVEKAPGVGTLDTPATLN